MRYLTSVTRSRAKSRWYFGTSSYCTQTMEIPTMSLTLMRMEATSREHAGRRRQAAAERKASRKRPHPPTAKRRKVHRKQRVPQTAVRPSAFCPPMEMFRLVCRQLLLRGRHQRGLELGPGPRAASTGPSPRPPHRPRRPRPPRAREDPNFNNFSPNPNFKSRTLWHHLGQRPCRPHPSRPPILRGLRPPRTHGPVQPSGTTTATAAAQETAPATMSPAAAAATTTTTTATAPQGRRQRRSRSPK
mmetsp:Transcript_66646/g.139147  ORF Transcript_66646/g.139147 Transcript_66646/m.139147 type:complete len:245 (-) Transcript_66646:205-939(-)